MYVVLHKALQGVTPMAEVLRLAAQDWQRDTGGREVMDKPLFRASFFEIADLWTDEISEVAYVAFLEFVVSTISNSGCLLQASSVKTVTRRQSALFLEKFKRAEFEASCQQQVDSDQSAVDQACAARSDLTASLVLEPKATPRVTGGDNGHAPSPRSEVVSPEHSAGSPRFGRLYVGSPRMASSPSTQSVRSMLDARASSRVSLCLWRPPSLLQARQINRFVR